MQCLYPTEAFIDRQSVNASGTGNARPIFGRSRLCSSDWCLTDNGNFLSYRYQQIMVPDCKRVLGHLCINCRKSRAWEITVRALAEKQADPLSPASFITLTCDDAHLPQVFPGGKLYHKPWQDFAKRLRKKIGPFRFLMCGEYGETSHRPHYHAIIYGHDLRDRSKVHLCSDSVLFGSVQHPKFGHWNDDGSYSSSRLIQDCWSFGHIMCDRVNDNRIAYVAGYELKICDELDFPDQPLPDCFDGCSTELVEEGYEDPDARLGSYVKWSRRPGLGASYLLKHPEMFQETIETLPDGHACKSISPSVIYHGHQVFFDGRYFKNLLARQDPDKYDIMQSLSQGRVLQKALHDTPYAQQRRRNSLENKARLAEYELAKKLRDVCQSA